MLTRGCEVDKFGCMLFFNNPDTNTPPAIPSGFLRVKRKVFYDQYKTYAEEQCKRHPRSAHSFYQSIRELKLARMELKVDNNHGFGFDLQALYQECIQRGYELEQFTIEGYKKKKDVIDTRIFDSFSF